MKGPLEQFFVPTFKTEILLFLDKFGKEKYICTFLLNRITYFFLVVSSSCPLLKWTIGEKPFKESRFYKSEFYKNGKHLDF